MGAVSMNYFYDLKWKTPRKLTQNSHAKEYIELIWEKLVQPWNEIINKKESSNKKMQSGVMLIELEIFLPVDIYTMT